MLKFTHLKKTKYAALGALLFAALGVCDVARGQQVLVPGSVSQFNATTGFTYSYSVSNFTMMDLAVITIPANSNSALMNLTAPTGFLITFDSGNGLFSFLEDNNQNTPQTFAPGSTVSGFSFTSFYAPGTATFDALDISGNDYMGNTIAPTNAVPEPTSVALVLVGFAFAGGIFVRRRSASQIVSIQ